MYVYPELRNGGIGRKSNLKEGGFDPVGCFATGIAEPLLLILNCALADKFPQE